MASWFPRFYAWYFGRYPTWSVEAYEAAVKANGYAGQPQGRKRQPRHKAPKWRPVTQIPSYNNAEAFGY